MRKPRIPPPRGISKASRVIFSVLTLLFLSIGQMWGTSYVSYNGETQDVSTTISTSNVSSGTAGKISWTGNNCSYSSSRVNISANGYITFTADEGFNITKVELNTGTSNDYVGTWSATAGTVSASTDNKTITVTGINANSVKLTTTSAYRCTSGGSIKIYYATAASYTADWYVGEDKVKAETNVTTGTPPNVNDNALGGSCSSLKFVGWSATNIGSTPAAAPDDLFTGTKSLTADATFYAVFAEVATPASVTNVFSDAMNISGNSGVSSRNGWNSFSSAYGGSGSLRLSTGSANGTATTNALTSLTSAETTISFQIAKWSNDTKGSVTLSANTGTIANTSFSTTSNDFTDVSTTISGGASTTQITFTGKSGERIYIRNITIARNVPAIYQNYITTCCTSLVPISGTATATTATSGTVAWTIPTDASSNQKAAGVILHLYADNNNAKGDEITTKQKDLSSDNTTTSWEFTGLNPSTKYWFAIELIGKEAGGITYCNSGVGDAVSFSTGAASNSWTITYNANGEGVTNMPTETYADKTTQEGTLSSTEPERTGYTFLGWDKSSGATTATYAAGGTITGVDANTNLYAVWEQRTVSLNAGSGTASGSPLTPNAQGKVILPSATPSAACAEIGWEFVGWAETEATGVKPATIIPAGEYTPAAKMTLYAVYGELGNTYTKITNAADFTTGNYVFAIAAGQALNNVLNSDNKAAGKNVSITSGTTISTTSSDADIIWQVTKSSDNYTLYNAAITKYLNIVPNTSDNYGHLELEADSRNYTVDMSNGDVRLWAPGKSSNQVIEYYNAFTCYGSVNNNALIYAFKQDYDSYVTSPNCTAYTLSSSVDPADKGNVALGKTSLLPGAQTTAEATPIDGYRFLNWTITGTGATMSNTSEGKSTDNPVTVTMGSENATITAHFEAIPTYDIEFSVNGSKVNTLKLDDQLEGTPIVFPDAAAITAASAFPETDKTFVGWTNEENKDYSHATDAPTLITSATATADVTYYAVFADVEESEIECAYDGDLSFPITNWEKTNARGAKNTDDGAWQMYGYSSSTNPEGEINTSSSYSNLLSLDLNAKTGNNTTTLTVYYSSDKSTWTELTTKAISKNQTYDDYTISLSGIPASAQYLKIKNSTNSLYIRSITIVSGSVSAYTTTISPLSSIAITTPATKTAYKKGETLDLTDLVVTATYEDASTRPVTNYSVTPSLTTPLTTDVTSFTVTYSEGSVQNKTANQTINVYALTGLSVTTGPTKTEYNAGESFDPAGMVVEASWGNGAITNPNVTGYTYSTDPLTNGTDHNITVDVTITYTSAGDEVTTTQEVTVIPRPSLTMTWNVAGSTTTSEIFANAQDKYLLALPENNPNPVDAGFTSDFVFKGWTKATSVNKDGTSIDYAAANDEQTQAETFYAVFAQKNGEDIPAGYKLKDEAPEAGETIIFARKVSETYYAFTKTASTSAMTITNGIVSSSTDDILWDPKTTCGTSTATGLFYFVSGQTTNLIHMNTSSFNITNGATNGDIVFSSNGDGSYKATRADGARWIVTNGTNGLGVSATESNAAALYIFKYSAASYATYSNYRLVPSSVKAPTGLTAGTYYCESKTITLAQEDGKDIYYTLDGTTPSTTNGTKYTSPFSINANCTIKAVAYDGDEEDYSIVAEAAYVIVTSIDAPTMPASGKFYGASKEVAITHALAGIGDFAIHYSYDDASYDDYSAALNITATQTVYAYATIGELTSDKVSATYTKGEAVTYKKITSEAELVPGMQFIIVSNKDDAYYATKSGALGSSSNAVFFNAQSIEAPNTENEITIGDEPVSVFVLGGAPSEWTLTAEEGQLYCNAAKKVNYSSNGVGTWDILFNEGVPTIASTNTDFEAIRFNYNNGEPRFTTYTSSMADVAIYMRKPGYERTIREGYYGTICLPNGGKMIGTTLYEIAYYDAVEEKIFFDEVLDGNMVAGMPYIFQPVEGAQKLYQYSNASHADSPVPAADANGLVGNLGSTITLSAGDYFLYNNQYYVVSASETRTISVPQYYAYIDMSEVSHQPTSPQPNRRRIAMSVHGEQVATGMDELNASEAPVKVMIDGKFYILRGEKMYDATGKLVK